MVDQAALEDEDLFGCYQAVDKTVPKERPIPFVGLRNLGNSCFFNSVLQVLIHCPDFRRYFTLLAEKTDTIVGHEKHAASTNLQNMSESDRKKYKVFREFKKLCMKISNNQLSIITSGCGNGEGNSEHAIEPHSLLESVQEAYPSFEPCAQQDAQECLQCLLDILHDSLLLFTNKKEEVSTTLLKTDPTKVLGGSKGHASSVLQSFADGAINGKARLLKGMSATFTRKRVGKSLFKNPLKRIKESDKENAIPTARSSKDLSMSPISRSKDTSILADTKSHSKISPSCLRKRKSSEALLPCEKGMILANLKEASIVSKRKQLTNLREAQGSFHDKGNARYENHVPNSLSCTENESLEFGKGKTFIENLFQGEIVNESRCVECENCARKVENFMDLSLPVRQNEKLSDDELALSPVKLSDGSEKNPNCSVTWGLSAFTSREMLDGENKYYCEVCGRYCEGERRLLLNRLPPVLTFHLKRFTSSIIGDDNLGISVSKINTCFDISMEMTLKEWCSDSFKDNYEYSLFAIIVHSGSTVCSGHYLAYIRLQESVLPFLADSNAYETLKSFTGQWLETDDERVRIISEDKLKEVIVPDSHDLPSRTPYLLFYSRNP